MIRRVHKMKIEKAFENINKNKIPTLNNGRAYSIL